ncbi:MAG TPA: DUF6036 family nucleotidyltransferase [Polyangiaceae bacterium]|nr:DUF6036 family nucleotidyltransferase [Polyangiaceae bacterium]
MNRRALEHIIRASADIADDDEIIVIGSQSVLGQFPDAPEALRVSDEADVYPKNRPERWDVIDGSIGEGSPFHETYGYYAQGVEDGTAILPSGWKDRLIAVRNANTRNATGYCLEVHDLAVSKYVAGREKDRRFIRDAARYGLIDEATTLARIGEAPIDPEHAARIRDQVALDFSEARRPR